MRDRLIVIVFVAVLVIVLLVVVRATRDDGGEGAAAPDDPEELFRAAAREFEGGYRLRVEQSNFVLPQWGGADGGTVAVSGDGRRVRAELARTGEADATYTILVVDGETFFRRSTCGETFRIPGGGNAVLDAFNFPKTGAFDRAAATATRVDGETVRARLEPLGEVVVTFAAGSTRPTEIRGTAGGRPLSWTFEGWGESPMVEKPAPPVQDRGPGGIPC